MLTNIAQSALSNVFRVQLEIKITLMSYMAWLFNRHSAPVIMFPYISLYTQEHTQLLVHLSLCQRHRIIMRVLTFKQLSLLCIPQAALTNDLTVQLLWDNFVNIIRSIVRHQMLLTAHLLSFVMHIVLCLLLSGVLSLRKQPPGALST